jgi:hypothetical protein
VLKSTDLADPLLARTAPSCPAAISLRTLRRLWRCCAATPTLFTLIKTTYFLPEMNRAVYPKLEGRMIH